MPSISLAKMIETWDKYALIVAQKKRQGLLGNADKDASKITVVEVDGLIDKMNGVNDGFGGEGEICLLCTIIHV